MADNKLTPGDTINCVGWDWVVLDADDEKSFVLAKKAMLYASFDKNGSNDFANSTLCDFLNNDLVRMLEWYGTNISAAIIPNQEGEKISLLTAEQYAKYQNLIPCIGKRWWLRSSAPCRTKHAPNVGSACRGYAAYVKFRGSVGDFGMDVRYDFVGVRPAMYLKTAAADFCLNERISDEDF